MTNARERIRQLARESIARGDLTGWFEQIYAEAQGDTSGISWADLAPNPHLMAWVNPRTDALNGKKALVVGCGLGDDAEALSALGMRVTAFDISQTAVDWCKRRFPDTNVEYLQADAVSPPKSWHSAFDLVVEIYTLQVLVPELRRQAVQSIAGCAAPNGQLLVICRGREPSDPADEFPWPLTKAELNTVTGSGLHEESFEDFMDGDIRRFCVTYRRS